jgi:hypothetical protein
MDRYEDLANRLEKQRESHPVDETFNELVMKAMQYMSPPTELEDGTPVNAGVVVGFGAGGRSIPGSMGEYLSSGKSIPGEVAAVAETKLNPGALKAIAAAERLGKRKDILKALNMSEDQAMKSAKKGRVFSPSFTEDLAGPQRAKALSKARQGMGHTAEEFDQMLAELGFVKRAPTIWDKFPKKTVATATAFGLGGTGGVLDMLYPDDRGYAPESDLPWSQTPRAVHGPTGLDADGRPLGKVEPVRLTPEELAKKLDAMGKDPDRPKINWQ